jgi:dTDP-4-dehydrorhamnose 3,5-epimerase
VKLIPLSLSGAHRVELTPHGDARGFFARTFACEVFEAAGLPTQWPHMNLSFTAQTHSVRGLHFQRPPCADAKIVRCIRGAIFDVIVDLRQGSPGFGRWHGEELSAGNRTALYIPPGFAHGFQTLQPETEILYMHSDVYAPDLEGGVSVTDPGLGIGWPHPVQGLSDRDAALPDLNAVEPIAL